jgi:hypothetical protein
VSLGLLSLVAELASLCPDSIKRRLLLNVHRTFITSPAAQDPGLVGAGWMPPEAAVAKANRVARHSAWSCLRCSLCNAPDDSRCEACGMARPTEEEQLSAGTAALSLDPRVSAAAAATSVAVRYDVQSAASGVASGSGEAAEVPKLLQRPPAEADFPPLFTGGGRRDAALAIGSAGHRRDTELGGGGAEEMTASPSNNKGKKAKGTTIKIGLPTSGPSPGSSSRPHPQNAWTQPAFKAKVGNSWSGQGAGKVAKMHGAMNEAWE